MEFYNFKKRFRQNFNTLKTKLIFLFFFQCNSWGFFTCHNSIFHKNDDLIWTFERAWDFWRQFWIQKKCLNSWENAKVQKKNYVLEIDQSPYRNMIVLIHYHLYYYWWVGVLKKWISVKRNLSNSRFDSSWWKCFSSFFCQVFGIFNLLFKV